MGSRALQAGNLFLLLLAAFYLFEARDLGMWRGDTPGSRFMPLLLGTCLGCIALLLFVSETRRQPPSMPVAFPSPLPFILVVVLAVYLYLLPYLGYGIASSLLMLACLRLYEPHRWRADLLGAAAVGLGFHLVFVVLLAVELPPGGLERVFGG